MENTPQLTGKAAIVTGGSRGIGFAIAEALASEGINVAISGVDERRLRDAADRLSRRAKDGARVEPIQADVRDADAVQRLIDGAAAQFGRIDILINNAGIGRFAEVADQSLEDWHRIIETNLTGVFYCCRAAIPHLRRAGGGWIINISSLAGKNAFAGGAAYCASKAGLNLFSEVLMQEVRYDDIRVSYVMPGSVFTEFGRNSGEGAEWKLTAEDVARVVLDLVSHDRRSLPSRVELRPSKPRK